MNRRRIKFGLLLLPSVGLGIVARVSWQRLHPPATALDTQVRARLLSADKIEVEIENCEIPIGSISRFVTRLPVSELEPVVDSLNLVKGTPTTWGTGQVPVVYLKFSKGYESRGSLTVAYGSVGYNYYWSSQPDICQALHPTTSLRLRTLISHHPEITSKLAKMGATPKDLDPRTVKPNDDRNQ